jgi:hypothetical protein
MPKLSAALASIAQNAHVDVRKAEKIAAFRILDISISPLLLETTAKARRFRLILLQSPVVGQTPVPTIGVASLEKAGGVSVHSF